MGLCVTNMTIGAISRLNEQRLMDADRERKSAEAWGFEHFIRDLMLRRPDITVEPERGSGTGLGADIVAMRGAQPVLVEVKVQTPQTRTRLRNVVTQLQAASAAYRHAHPGSPSPHLVIAFPGVLSPRKEIPPEVEVWDGRYLQQQARELGVQPHPLLATAEGEERTEEREPADELISRLGSITPGHGDWSRYEKFCEDMLSFLFCPPLNQVICQSRNETGINRRDFILPNYATEGYWNFLRVHYQAEFVVAEAKNLAASVRKEGVLQLANYLNRKGTGLVGMLLTRNGFSYDAKVTSREQWLLHDKLIVGFDDQDYRQMLASKRAGDDPSHLVRQRIEDFRLRI
jgi:hypothetical protein